MPPQHPYRDECFTNATILLVSNGIERKLRELSVKIMQYIQAIETIVIMLYINNNKKENAYTDIEAMLCVCSGDCKPKSSP